MKAVNEAERQRTFDLHAVEASVVRLRGRPGAGHANLHIAVELDGYAHHHDRTVFQRDRDKGNALTEAGWTLLRFTHDDIVRRPDAMAAQLRRMLHRRAA